MSKTKVDEGKGCRSVTGASRERKEQEGKLARLPRRSRSASNVEQRGPTEMVRLSVKLKMIVDVNV
jgi:hypothetical protein